MEMKNRVELVKRLDENDCVLTWSASAQAAFILASVEEFRTFIMQRIKEHEDKQKADKEASESSQEAPQDPPKAG